MNLESHHIPLVRRLAVGLLTGILLLATVGCGGQKKDSWLDFGTRESARDEAIEELESRFDKLEANLSGLVFWQTTAALLFVLCGFALVGGAALGSRARRDQQQFLDPSGGESPTPDESAA